MAAVAEQYDAFVSYARDPDARFADRIVTDLKRIGRRWRSDALLRVCFDRTSLAASHSLPESIKDKLAQSKHLVLLASRGAVRSPWVEREIEAWLSHSSPERILLVLTDGDLAAKDERFTREGSTALPNVLYEALTTEPLWVDLRPFRSATRRFVDRKAYRRRLAEIAAPLVGRPTEELSREDERIQRRQLGLARALLAAVTVSAIAAAHFGLGWLRSRRVEAATQLAESALHERERDPELALALAVASAELHPSLEVNNALLRVLATMGRLCRLGPHYNIVTSVSFDAHGARALTASMDRTARLWELGSQRLLSTLRPRGEPLTCAALDPSGQHAFTMESNGRISLWDATSGRMLQRLPLPAGMFGPWPRFEREGRLVSLVHTPGSRRAWSVEEGTEIELTDREPPEVDPGWLKSPDGRWSARIDEDGSARIWDFERHAVCARLAPPGEMLSAVAFRPDGREVVTCSGRAAARIWSTANWKPKALVSSPEQPIAHAYYSPDGRWLVTEPFFHANTQERTSFRVGGREMRAEVAPSQALFALHVWNAETLERWLVLDLAGVIAANSAIDPTATQLAVPMEDGSVLLAPLDPLTAARRVGVRALTSSERAHFDLPEQP